MFQELSCPKLKNVMKNLVLSLVFLLGFSWSALAQPVMTLNDATVNNGDAGCITVTIGSFAPLGIPNIFSIENVQFQWDPASFNNINIQNINPAVLGLDVGDFSINQGAGNMVMDWVYLECTQENDLGPGVDFPNINSAMPVFDICFDAAFGDYGTCAPIEIVNPANDPPVVRRAFTFNVGCPNIGMVINEPGCVFFDVSPLQIIASQETGNLGDLVCVDFTVNNFTDLQSTQFDLNWDPTVLACVNQIPGDIPNLTNSNFNCLPGGDAMRISWASLPDQGVSVDDGTTFFTACFDILADCESFTSIDIDLESLVEITNTTSPGDGSLNIPYQYSSGSVTTGDCDPIGLQLFADCGGPVNINDEFCVEVTVGDNFFAITDMNFLMEWNEQILTYTGVQNFNSSVVNLNASSFTANPDNGFLEVEWEGPPPATISAGGTLFEVCFQVTGLGGNSPFAFLPSPSNVQSQNGPNIGIAPANCQIEVNQPDGVALNIGSGEGASGEEFCVDIAVANFDSITSFQYSLSWDPALFQLNASTVMNFPGASDANITESGPGGLLFFDYNGTDPITIGDGTSILQICFEPLGTPGTCDPLEMITIPLAPEAISASSNGENIGIIDTPGDLCTLFPEGFGIYVDTVSGMWLDTACVSVSVESFDNITDATFRLTWDPSILNFVELNDLGVWPGYNFTPGPGFIDFDWSQPGGLAIPDESDIFELCFELLEAPECTPVSVSEIVEPVISTTNGQGSLVYENGEICIEDRYIITDLVILPTSCPGECDGEIIFSVIGGTEPLGTTWVQNDQQQFNPFFATNLCAGDTVFVTVFDNSQPILLETFTFVVPLDTMNVPTVDAGEDATLSCNTGLAPLFGTVSAGADLTWTPPNGLTSPANPYFATEPGFYILTGENPLTGCAAKDTVQVFPGISPIAEAGDNLSFNCLSDTLMLDGTGSVIGDTITYNWTVLEGGNIVPGDETLLMPQVTGPGLYQIEVENVINQCSSTDTVRVENDQELPEAIINGGAETVTLSCEAAVILNAATENNPPVIVEYEWFDFENNSISTNPNIAIPDLGTYYLHVFNSLTGCEASDTIQVVPNEDFPVITTIPATDTSLTCLVDTIQIIATVDGVLPENFIFTWTASGGGQFVPDSDTTLMPMVVAEGVYSLEVTDTTTNCTALTQISVGLDTLSPIADAGTDLLLTCAIASDTLIGMNTSAGDNMAYSWTDTDGVEVGTEAFLIVDSEGVYCLQVTNLDNGCVATDCAEVFLNSELPVVTINEPVQNLSCENDTLTLQPDMIIAPNGDYDVLWTPGPFIGPDTLDFAVVDEPGVYTIAITDPVTGCIGTGEYIIGIDTIAPVADAGMDVFLDCDTDLVTLGSENSSTGPEFTYAWVNTVDGETPTPDNTSMVDVMTAGTYELTVLNTSNGCSSSDEIIVGEDFAEPVVNINDPIQITCIDECITLSAVVEGLTDITVEWMGLDGGAVEPANALETTVCDPGNYMVTITNNTNGCIGQDTVLVESDQTTPVIEFATPALITCANAASQIDASATGLDSDFSNITWTGPGNITPASGSLIVDVDAPGDYELSVTLASNGCSSAIIITVDSDTETPVADAGEDFILECGEVGAADGSGSSQGAEFEYLWTAISGNIVGDETEISPMVEGAGTYALQVINTENGCVSSDTVMISFEFPPDAMTMQDSLHCGDTITISANLPSGTSGVWTSLGGAVVESPTANTTEVAPLNPGNNLFIWTLSADGCPDYSADTLIIMSEVAPVANNDLIELTEEIRFGSTNILANDITSSSEVTITILSEPLFGQMDSLINGVYHYSVGPGAEGETEVTYQICSTNCPEKCDEATIIIIVPEDPNEPEVANTITPNEDGLNDMLIFDIIANNAPDEFPDNEIIIFNRWGDIVYSAAPYNNDWNGLNDQGNELPHGTYYYILRLNISKGEIIRGDVTIIR